MALPLWIVVLNLAAVINTALLCAIILIRLPKKEKSRALHLAGMLASVAIILFLFTAINQFWIPLTPFVDIAYLVLALLFPAHFVAFVRAMLNKKGGTAIFFMPAILLVVAALLDAQTVLSFVGHKTVIAVEVFYTGLVIFFLGKAYNRQPDYGRYKMRHLWVLTGLIVSLHIAQLIRIILPGNAIAFQVVPLIGGIFTWALVLYAFAGSPVIRQIEKFSARENADVPDLLRQMDHLMKEQKPYLKQDMKAGELADILDIPVGKISEALSHYYGITIPAYVNRYRIMEAKNMLRSEEHERTSVEAIGLLSGFKSRSAFYTAFEREVGESPAQYRKFLRHKNLS